MEKYREEEVQRGPVSERSCFFFFFSRAAEWQAVQLDNREVTVAAHAAVAPVSRFTPDMLLAV